MRTTTTRDCNRVGSNCEYVLDRKAMAQAVEENAPQAAAFLGRGQPPSGRSRRAPVPVRTAAALTAASYLSTTEAASGGPEELLLFSGVHALGLFFLLITILCLAAYGAKTLYDEFLVKQRRHGKDLTEGDCKRYKTQVFDTLVDDIDSCKRGAATQSQVTYTSVAKHASPRFKPLHELNQGVWRDNMRCPE